MIGTDITSIRRFNNKKISFVKRILSPEEIKGWNASENKSLFLAQRWSIKESLFKANNDFHDFSTINIKRNSKGKFEFKNYEISTSKEDDYVISVVLERK